MHGLKDSVLVCKIHGEQLKTTFHSCPRNTRHLQCVDVNNPLQKVYNETCL